MENEKKRTKMDKEHATEDEAEEERIEKFFALVRSTKEVRDWLRFNVAKETDQKEKQDAAAAGWRPTFQAEDFMEESNKSWTRAGAGPSKPEQEQKEPQGEENKQKGQASGLDLNLSL